jgi:ABC-type nitrate/sulfonate/bicarbonate transport system substrate-binding protein
MKIIAALLVLLSMCHPASAQTKIRVGGLTETVLIGIGKGWFREAGLDVEVTELPNILQYSNILASKSIDVMDAYLPPSFWNMVDSGAGFKIIGGSAVMVAAGNGEPARNPRMYLARRDLYDAGVIRNVHDFSNRKIADFVPVPPKGRLSPFPIGDKIFGKRYAEVDWIYMPSETNILAALEGKHVDGARLTSRWAKIAINKGYAVEIAKETDFVPLAQVRVVVTRSDFAQANPEALSRFMAIRLKAQKYAAEVQKGHHQPEFRAIVVRHSKVPPDIALELIEELRFTEELAIQDMMDTQAHFVKAGLQQRVIPLQDVVDLTFIDRAKTQK